MTYTFLKIPFDLGIIDKDRRGARLAPEVLTKQIKRDFSTAKIIDVPTNKDFFSTNESIYYLVNSELKKGNKIFAIGGDHSITFSAAKAFREHYPNSCIIIFDAHSDCEPDFIPPSHEGVTRALASTCFSPKDILLVGYRKARTKEEKEFIQKHNIKYIESKNITAKTYKKIHKFITNYDAVYLSIDIDVFDNGDAPGTGWPEKNGPNKQILISLLEKISKNDNLKNVDLVELSPPRDINKKTASLASDLLKIFATPKV